MKPDSAYISDYSESVAQLFEFSVKFNLSALTGVSPLFVKSPVLAYGSYKHFYPSEEKSEERLMEYIVDLFDLWHAQQISMSPDQAMNHYLVLANEALQMAYTAVSSIPNKKSFTVTREGLETWMQYQ